MNFSSTFLMLLVAVMPLVMAETPDKPNVILIMADDLGYQDLSGYGHPQIKTPVLDKLADDGIKLTSFYSGCTVCTPSRMALLTGAYPSRLGWTKGVLGYLISLKEGMSPQALTMAEAFKSKGYKTALTGKWHIGDLPKFLPRKQGFDLTYFIKKSNNQSRILWRNETLLEKPFENRLLTEKFTNEAISFIKKNKDNPFFLYIPYTAPHFPVQPHPEWKGKSSFGKYGDVVEEMDFRIGEVLKTLKEEKLDQKTIVIFMSDNGPQGGQKAQAEPFRGKKWSALEGGNRVPCIIRWPGVIPAARVSDKIISAIDVLPTLSHVCGIDLKTLSKESQRIDGVNVWGTLIGTKGFKHPRNDLLFWHGKDGHQAIRVGNWKLFLKGEGAALAEKGSAPVLFDLADENDEMTNLSAKYPEKVKEMEALAKKRLADINSHIIPLGK